MNDECLTATLGDFVIIRVFLSDDRAIGNGLSAELSQIVDDRAVRSIVSPAVFDEMGQFIMKEL